MKVQLYRVCANNVYLDMVNMNHVDHVNCRMKDYYHAAPDQIEYLINYISKNAFETVEVHGIRDTVHQVRLHRRIGNDQATNSTTKIYLGFVSNPIFFI